MGDELFGLLPEFTEDNPHWFINNSDVKALTQASVNRKALSLIVTFEKTYQDPFEAFHDLLNKTQVFNINKARVTKTVFQRLLNSYGSTSPFFKDVVAFTLTEPFFKENNFFFDVFTIVKKVPYSFTQMRTLFDFVPVHTLTFLDHLQHNVGFLNFEDRQRCQKLLTNSTPEEVLLACTLLADDGGLRVVRQKVGPRGFDDESCLDAFTRYFVQAHKVTRV